MNLRNISTNFLLPVTAGYAHRMMNDASFWPEFFSRDVVHIYETPFLELQTSIQLVNRIIGTFVSFFIPNIIDLEPENCCEYSAALSEINWKTLLQSDADFLIRGYRLCCEKSFSYLVALSFAEEVIVRLGVQKIAFRYLGKKIPGWPGRILSNPVSRILLSSTLFFLLHDEGRLKNQFVFGIISGTLFEKYGLLASTVSHITENFFNSLELKEACVDELDEVLQLLKERARQ